MKLLHRHNPRQEEQGDDDYYAERPLPDDAPEPLPERAEPRLAEPGPTDLSKRDYLAIVRRAFKEFGHDHMTNIAAALAYYAFLAIPSVLMVAVGVFSLVGDRSAANTIVDKLGGIIPHSAQTLLRNSLTTLLHNKGTGLTVLVVGSVLALWSLTGAMQNVMWAANVAYDREESRGFVRRRITALWMVVFGLLGALLAFGVLVLGPQLSTWIVNAVGARSLVK